MSQSNDLVRTYGALGRGVVVQFGERHAVELESNLETAAQHKSEVDNAEVHPDLDPLNRE